MYSIGLMSGTSMDGIDASLLETDGQALIIELAQIKLNYSVETKHLLKAAERASKKAQGDLTQAAAHYVQDLHEYLVQELQVDETEAQIEQLTTYLHATLQTLMPLSLSAVIQLSTELHAQAVQLLLEKSKKSTHEIDVIGYHGQTLYHNPGKKITVQVGDGAYLAELTGITVINQFRQRDVAAGGQGAPFAPIYHQALAQRDHKLPLAVVNCGGIANISLILGSKLTDLSGFDTGPGNGLIDGWVRKRTQGKQSIDQDGRYGLQGKIDEDIIQVLFEQAIVLGEKNYLSMPPPKSLDIRDLTPVTALDVLSLEDACATLEAFTAETIVRSLSLTALTREQPPSHWILAGGGWYNPVIKQQLHARLQNKYQHINFKIESASEAGWNNDSMEAQIFAYFAVRSLKNLPLSAPGTTGVPQPLSGGRGHLPPSGATSAVQQWLDKNPELFNNTELQSLPGLHPFKK